MSQKLMSEIMDVYFNPSFVKVVKKHLAKHKYEDNYDLHRYLATYCSIKSSQRNGATELNGHGVKAIHSLYTRAVDELK